MPDRVLAMITGAVMTVFGGRLLWSFARLTRLGLDLSIRKYAASPLALAILLSLAAAVSLGITRFAMVCCCHRCAPISDGPTRWQAA